MRSVSGGSVVVGEVSLRYLIKFLDADFKPMFRVYPGRCGEWRWECSFCWPPARGARFGPDAYRKVLYTSLPHHYRVRQCHHEHVASLLADVRSRWKRAARA